MRLAGIVALMFNNRAKKDAEKVLERLGIKKGDYIADIGSGGGFFTFQFAELAGAKGMVYACDIDRNLLAEIKKKTEKKKLKNIKTAICDERGCNLPGETCDMVFMRNVFHHIKQPTEYFKKLREVIKPGGKIAIIEWSPGKNFFQNRHSTSREEINKILQEAGFCCANSFDLLEKQSFQVFYRE